ncbi:NnrU family protein [Sphingomonas sp. 28-63-12]|uniref:NnrU family protein n=1 Tax=Sphingomonas sp. 28-63-12 TaxID=1970434 RepID=UPI000BC99A10|nr:MAG: MFS transporter [Sphingomonas sp. 28-63-12]
MDGTMTVAIAATSFVGSHFLLSHPLRAPLVKALGNLGFTLVYAVVAFATLGWMANAYKAAPITAPLWPVGDVLWAVSSLIMLLASVLLMGSLIGNPALPGPAAAAPAKARGAFAITRHPMMWSFALWSLAHVLVFPVEANIILAVAIAILALVGAALQDAKKRTLVPEVWHVWEQRTGYWPFAAIAAGKAKFGGFRPHDIAGGAVIWLAATWAHLPMAGIAAGIWRWVS